MMILRMKKWKEMKGCNPGAGAVYGLGFVGALIYYLQQAGSFGEGILGVLKAMVWPAMLIYKVLGFFKM